MVVSFCGWPRRWRGQQPADVLDDYPFGLERVDSCGHVCPEPGARAGCETGALADGGNVLARKASDEDVHGLDLAPVDDRDVTEVRCIWPVAGEDAGDGLVEFGEPHAGGVEDVLDGEVEAAVAAEQRSDPEF